MSLKEIITQLVEKQAESRVDPSECDPRVRSGAEGLVRAAKVAVEQLELQYKTEVIKAVVVIAVHGPGAEQFAKISQSAFKALTVDFHYILDNLAQAVKSHGGQSEYNSQEHWLLVSELMRVRQDYEIASIQPPVVNYQKDGVYLSPLRQAIQVLIEKNYGNSLYSVVSHRLISRLALQAQFTGKTLPVVLYNCKGDVDNLSLPLPTCTIHVKEGEANEDFVKNVFLNVKNQIKKNNNEKEQE